MNQNPVTREQSRLWPDLGGLAGWEWKQFALVSGPEKGSLPQSGGSLESLESLNSLGSLDNGFF